MEHTINFWDLHGLLFVFFMCFFPRLTMLFATAVGSTFGGPLFWIGWLLVPRLTVAIIGTTLYWDTNPIVCILSWLWALGGESSEKKVVVNKVSRS